ncbi:MAG: VacB/RNase II family 3'-5' exoribonuclease [Akkermansia sp.]|nr:VacB/RNase II family 3'-5' exoribonuclease [Akkermansia sp.]
MESSSLSEQLYNYLSSPGYTPQELADIGKGMGLHPTQRRELKSALAKGVIQGRIIKLRKSLYMLRKPVGGELTGRISQRGGRLFFVADAASAPRLAALQAEDGCGALYVAPYCSKGAMDGDRVEVSVRVKAPARSHHNRHRPHAAETRIEVRVLEILERGRNRWVGSYKSTGRYGHMVGDGRTSPELVRLLSPPPAELLPGMVVVVEPVGYPIANSEATGRITQVLGWPEDEGVQITTVMHKYGLADTFPADVLEESERISDTIDVAELDHRDDWRKRCVITIDPETARDYDDAIAVSRHGTNWELAVHIADVSHYVRPGSALDREARERGNSTYLPDRVLPMLPPRLCDGICSLREGEDRLTRLCLMQINRQGKVFKAEFRDAVICSRRRLTYPQVLQVLQGQAGTGDCEVDSMLREAAKLAQLLRRKRYEAGALRLDMPEIRLLTDDQGAPVDVEVETSDESHQLIEEFMLIANECVAHALNAQGLPAIYRVHEAPDPAKLNELSQELKLYGIKAGTLATREELNAVMDKIEGHPDEAILKVRLLRAMMRARYSTNALGHYGLAKGDYCHFTSPIRRYADLVVHRAFSRLSGTPSLPLPSITSLAATAEHISETERNSAAAENEAQQLMMGRFLELQCESENPRVWDAVVLTCWPQGLAVEIPLLKVKGFVSGADLPHDTSWYFERHAERWTSTDARCLYPGASLRVIPTRVDSATGFADFLPVALGS